MIHRIIASFLVKQAALKRTAANTGAVTLIQRFGSAANLNIHLHCLVLDGVYRNSTAVFHEVAAPTLEELQALLAKIITRIMRWLTKQGFLIEEQDRTYLTEADRESTLLPLQAASCTYRIALGPRAGQKVLSLQSVASPDKSSTPDLCAKLHGFSLHAAVRWGADQRKELEHLCRYITRPAIANERLKRNRAGQVVLQLKSAFKDGTSHIVMSPLEFMQRLAALVPPPALTSNPVRQAQGRHSMRLVKSPVYFFSCRLAHRLTGDVRQVIVLIVRLIVSPHDENNFQPLRCQSPKRLGMMMSFRPLVAIVLVRPLTAIERVKRQPVQGVSHQLVTGKTKQYDMALAAGLGYRDSPASA